MASKRKKKTSLFRSIVAFIAWVLVVLLWGCAASVWANPATYGSWLGVVGLCFPALAIAVGVVFLFCLLLRLRQAWIPLVGLIACCGSVRDYFPINLSSPAPKSAIRVMSYNCMAWGGGERDGRDYVVARFVGTSRADIVCLQEAGFTSNEMFADVEDAFRRYGYHFRKNDSGFSALACVSRYPIVGDEVVCKTSWNAVVAFYLTPTPRDTIIVVNAHLESMGLTLSDRGQFHELVENPEGADTIHGKLVILSKIADASCRRAAMADTLAAFVDRHRGKKLFVMGDFNDTPISYAHHQMCRRLTDAYRATANGAGRSFNRDAIYVRIDNIFCSGHYRPFACKVDATVPFSDHYPIIASFVPRP